MFTGSSPAETNNEVMPRYPTRCHKSWECPLSCHRSELLVYLSLGSKNHLKQKHHLDTIEKKFLGVLFLFMNFGGLLCFPIKKKKLTNLYLSISGVPTLCFNESSNQRLRPATPKDANHKGQNGHGQRHVPRIHRIDRITPRLPDRHNSW